MTSIVSEIMKLRDGIPFEIDYKNTNRYRVVVVETDGSRTAYYFGTPIYHCETRKVVDLKFHRCGEGICSTGSSATIHYGEDIELVDTYCRCRVSLGRGIRYLTEKELVCGDGRIYNTTNGFVCRMPCRDQSAFVMTLDVDTAFAEIRANDHYFALMTEKFRPAFVCSAIGTVGEDDEVVAPVRMSYQKITDRRYAISFTPCTSRGEGILFEFNMYEHKLFQDTTVESHHPQVNNAFGSVAFLGETKELGVQWLYSRPDVSCLPELFGKTIKRAALHMPRLNHTAIAMKALKLTTRFCSFGSTWDNRVSSSDPLANSTAESDYVMMDVTEVLVDKHGHFSPLEGMVLKPQNRNDGFSVIATGDCYFSPQILEVAFC